MTYFCTSPTLGSSEFVQVHAAKGQCFSGQNKGKRFFCVSGWWIRVANLWLMKIIIWHSPINSIPTEKGWKTKCNIAKEKTIHYVGIIFC